MRAESAKKLPRRNGQRVSEVACRAAASCSHLFHGPPPLPRQARCASRVRAPFLRTIDGETLVVRSRPYESAFQSRLGGCLHAHSGNVGGACARATAAVCVTHEASGGRTCPLINRKSLEVGVGGQREPHTVSLKMSRHLLTRAGRAQSRSSVHGRFYVDPTSIITRAESRYCRRCPSVLPHISSLTITPTTISRPRPRRLRSVWRVVLNKDERPRKDDDGEPAGPDVVRRRSEPRVCRAVLRVCGILCLSFGDQRLVRRCGLNLFRRY